MGGNLSPPSLPKSRLKLKDSSIFVLQGQKWEEFVRSHGR